MNFKNILDDDDAVSPVIGVILMVAITVILAAVIGTFVLGLGDQVSNTSPSASFTFDLNDMDNSVSGDHDVLTVTHDGGDKIEGSNLNATVSGATNGSAGNDEVTATVDMDVFTGSITAGSTDDLDETTLDEGAGPSAIKLDGATVRVVWSSSDGGDSATLGKWTGPDA